MSSESSEKEPKITFVFQAEEEISSGEDPPMSEWSSLERPIEEVNIKKILYSQGLYSPGSGEICTHLISTSHSDLLAHQYFNYPAVTDPGIEEAILDPEKPLIHSDDGQSLYLSLCLEMNTCPVRIFHRGLITENIDLAYYGVNPAGFRAMAIALQYNKFVKQLNLTDNFLNDDACYHLGQMLNVNATLEELNLSGCRIGPSGLLRLVHFLHINTSLITLNISRNNIGEQGGVTFATKISEGLSVARVNLSKNQLGKQTALALAEAFEFRDKITHLDLSLNYFLHSPTSAKMLESLGQSLILEELDLSWNSLEGERVAQTIKHITLVPTLKILNLSHNKFQGEAIPIIVGNLVKAKKLNILDLSFNPLKPEDALVVIEKMLKPRVKITQLAMAGIWVNKNFLAVYDKVRTMKSRKNFVLTFDGVLENWTIQGADARETVLKRADYLGNLSKKNKVDIALFFLGLYKENPKPISFKELIEICERREIPLNDGLMSELAVIFPGPKSAKTKFIDLRSLCEFISRLWPDKKLPQSPPPESESAPATAPALKASKGKKGKK